MSFVSNPTFTIARLKELLSYDPETGIVTRLTTGTIVLTRTVKLEGEAHSLPRYIWALYYGEWPPENLVVDHEDRNPYNNKITNLRLATYEENWWNSDKAEEPNPNGHSGISKSGRKGKPWLAQMRWRGIKINLGRYETKEEAAQAYIKAVATYRTTYNQTEGTIHAVASETSEQ